MSKYVVLRQTARGGADSVETWERHDEAEAPSSDAAIRATADTAGSYVAVPERSFQAVSVKIETQKKVTLS